MSGEETHDATFWLQIDATLASYMRGGEYVRSIKAVGLTQKRPQRQKPGTVMIKLTVRVPDAVFMPLEPEAVIVVPGELTQSAPILVQAEDAHDETP